MPSRRAVLTTLGAAGLGTLAGCGGASAAEGAWPRAAYDRGNTRAAPRGYGPGPSLARRWQADLPDNRGPASPVLVDGRVYVGYQQHTDDGETVGIRTLDTATGSPVADVTVTRHEGYQPYSALLRDSVVVANGALYLVAFDGAYSLTPAGEQRWHVPIEGGLSDLIMNTGHPVVAEGRAYVPTAGFTDNTSGRPSLYAVDDATGTVDWRYTVPTKTQGWPFPPAYAGGTVFVAATGYGLVALDAASGEVQWERRLAIEGPPTVADGRVFVTTEMDDPQGDRSHVVALDATSGGEIWRSSEDGERLGRGLSVRDGRLYYRERLEEVVARDAATGEELWRNTEFAGVDRTGPTVTDEALYTIVKTGPQERGLTVLDPSTGERQAFAETGGGLVNGSVALGDDVAIVNTARGTAVLFESCTTTLGGRCVVS